jgi:hypothetical protein
LLLLRRLLTYIRNGEKFGTKRFWTLVVLDQKERSGNGPEYIELITDSPEEIECTTLDGSRKAVLAARESEEGHFEEHDAADTIHWSNLQRDHRHHHRHSSSMASDQTLFHPGARDSDDDLCPSKRQGGPQATLLSRVGTVILATLERSLIFVAWALSLTGIVTYTGICRGNYINGCLAHLISTLSHRLSSAHLGDSFFETEGSLFWCYGLISFARFLGSYAELGWAWNRTTTKSYLSGEFVESLVIFTYGITNTWMERFGANPGDPFTTKQIQHISIAVSIQSTLRKRDSQPII